MTTWDNRGLIEDLLARALDDWLHIADFVGVARRLGLESEEGLRSIAAGLIAQVLCRHLMVAGDLDELGFHAWPGNPGEAVERLIQEWAELDLSPTPGAVAWFANTELGDEIGRRVHQREVRE